MRIAFAGNPNSGKTTMFNALTGRNEHVGNWAGVTVDKKESPIKKIYYEGDEQIIAIDLPGAYSMSAFTSEESIASTYIKDEKPDVIINIVDATNLSRSLFFTTQILELGIPVVVALNKSDVNKKRKTKIDIDALSEELGCPVVMTVSVGGTHEGLMDVVREAVNSVSREQKIPYVEGYVDYNDKKSVQIANKKRFEYVNKLVKKVENRKVFTNQRNFQDKIDKIITNKWIGLPIFAVVMFMVFQISQAWVGPFIADGILVPLLEKFQSLVAVWTQGTVPIVQSLIVDGVIGGVIAVIGFLPLVMVMYFIIALLEDCGYMARASVVLDPIFKKVGLSGKSIIPFVIGTGCAVPGVMACRTIRDERERRATAMLAPFMPCGAKLPVISLFAGAFFENASWVGTLMYFMGIAIIFVGAFIINGITGFNRKKSFFIIEMPEYKMPNFLRASKSMLSRGWSYIVKAGTVILLCNTVVQIMQSFDMKLGIAQSADTSILATVAGPVSYLLVPVVGIVSWQLTAASVAGFIAKENVVGTLAVCYVGLENLIDTEELALMEGAAPEVTGVFAITKVAALAYLMFNLFSPPCFAAIGAMNSEMKSAKWLWGGIALQFGIGFTIGYLVYTFGTLFTNPTLLGIGGTIGGAIAVGVFVLVIAILICRTNKKMNSEQKQLVRVK